MSDYGLDLAVIGNGRTAALLEPSSRIVWWCLPRYDGDPVFCRLLSGDEDKGFTDVVLDGRSRRSNYVRNTAIVVTELIDDKGAGVRITDFAPRFQIYGRTFRPPQIIRIIEPIGGHAAHHHPFSPHASLRRTGCIALFRQQSHPLLAR